ncbi:MAG TPA: N-acetylneuraminate synthase family protein [Pyrinomonadaceae bacterium]|nr:N-acetylneuraminate synthase family protein [Pyrinomonadaceae bacterium]
MVSRNIFEDLFVLEMTNNHLGRLDRGIDIVRQHARVVHANNVRAAIKVQFRDVNSFIHEDFKQRTDIRYVRRVRETEMNKGHYAALIQAIRDAGCIPMATPFDEASVDWCVDFDLPIIKVASADVTDWQLLKRIAATKKPVIVSIGGASEQDIDDMVQFFQEHQTPLAINHCIAAYPHEAEECELNQIDYLRHRYAEHTIGYSSHEHRDWVHSMTISYAKGARTFERHIDIDTDGASIADYSSLPHEIDDWFKAFQTAKRYCGASPKSRIRPLKRETDFLDNYIRGAYATRELPAGHVLTADDVQLAIPIRKGQVSCREFREGEVLLQSCSKGAPIRIDMVSSDYASNPELRNAILERGIEDPADEPSVVKFWRVPRKNAIQRESKLPTGDAIKQCG